MRVRTIVTGPGGDLPRRSLALLARRVMAGEGGDLELQIILTGDPISAEDALSFGLVMKVVAKDKLLQEANTFACKLAALPRLALEASKMLINKGLEVDLASGLEMEARCFGNLAGSHDLREGILAFLEKRKPNFKD